MRTFRYYLERDEHSPHKPISEYLGETLLATKSASPLHSDSRTIVLRLTPGFLGKLRDMPQVAE